MKFCIICGRRLPDEAVFCSKCGLNQQALPEDIENSPVANQIPVNSEFNQQPQTSSVMLPPFMPAPQRYYPQNIQGIYAPMQQIPQNQPYFQPQQAVLTHEFENDEKRLNTTLFFVWSIILIFIINPLGTPLAIFGTLFAGMARSSDTTYEQASKNIKVSKVLCVIATCIDVLCIIAVAVLLIYLLKTGMTIIPSRSGTQV